MEPSLLCAFVQIYNTDSFLGTAPKISLHKFIPCLKTFTMTSSFAVVLTANILSFANPLKDLVGTEHMPSMT